MKSLVYKNTLCFVDLYYNDIHSLTKCLALHVDKEFLVMVRIKVFMVVEKVMIISHIKELKIIKAKF